MVQEVCIVGGGISGAGAAYALRDAADVTVFEASEIGGRMASHRRDDCVYDFGANYLEVADEELEGVVTDAASDVLTEIEPPVWRFDATGEITQDRTQQHTRWSARDGLEQIVHSMFASAGATVETGRGVTSIARTDERWRVTASGEDRTFDALVLAVPAESARVLLRTAEWDDDFRTYLADVAESIPYRTMDTVALHYPFELDAPYFGLVSLESVYDIAWLSREHCKPGHVPDGESVIIVQLGPAWVTTNPHVDPEDAATAAAHRAVELVDDDRLDDPDWWEYQRWGGAIPAHGPGDSLLDRSYEYDLALAGDWVVGIGRTRAALRSGLEAGRELRIEL